MTDRPLAFALKAQKLGLLLPPHSIQETANAFARCSTKDHPQKHNGAYLYTDKGDFAFGYLHNWETGQSQAWCSHQKDVLTASQKRSLTRAQNEARELAKRETQERQQAAQAKAITLWQSAQACITHPYLQTKGVSSYGLKIAAHAAGQGDLATLLIPVMDVQGQMHGLQKIYASSDTSGQDQFEKRFLTGTAKQGHFYALGDLTQAQHIGLAEGYATAASLQACLPVDQAWVMVLAFDAGNLMSVASTLTAYYPKIPMTLFADNDGAAASTTKPGNSGNVGLESALAVVKQLRSTCQVAVPSLLPGQDQGQALAPLQSLDFNDLQQLPENQESTLFTDVLTTALQTNQLWGIGPKSQVINPIQEPKLSCANTHSTQSSHLAHACPDFDGAQVLHQVLPLHMTRDDVSPLSYVYKTQPHYIWPVTSVISVTLAQNKQKEDTNQLESQLQTEVNAVILESQPLQNDKNSHQDYGKDSAHNTHQTLCSTYAITVYRWQEDSLKSEDLGLVERAILPPGFTLSTQGLYYTPGGSQAEENKLFISSYVAVVANTHQADHAHGRLLRYRTPAGEYREVAIAMSLLSGSGEELRVILLDRGVNLSTQTKARNWFNHYIQSSQPKRTVECVAHLGWHQGHYVLPQQIVGTTPENFTLQSPSLHSSAYQDLVSCGSLAGWQDWVAQYAPGNDWLLFALCAAFAPPLLSLCDVEGGGFHLVGKSSTGKTTILRVAASVWGKSSLIKSWRSTDNGLEAICEQANDNLLLLDELGQCNEKVLAQVLYMLANGQGKQRANRWGSYLAQRTWHTFILSSGERSPQEILEQAQQRAELGQAVRLLNLETQRTYGVFDKLHSRSAAEFVKYLHQAISDHHGHAGLAFIQKLVHQQKSIKAQWQTHKRALQECSQKVDPRFDIASMSSIIDRAANRFATLSLAGALAIDYEVLPLSKGSAQLAIQSIWQAWLESQANQTSEQIIIEILYENIIQHLDTRFTSPKISSSFVSDQEDKIRNHQGRAGWYEGSHSDMTYYLLSNSLEELAKPYTKKEIIQAIRSAKVGTGESKPKTIAGTSVRVYELNFTRYWQAQHGAKHPTQDVLEQQGIGKGTPVTSYAPEDYRRKSQGY